MKYSVLCLQCAHKEMYAILCKGLLHVTYIPFQAAHTARFRGFMHPTHERRQTESAVSDGNIGASCPSNDVSSWGKGDEECLVLHGLTG